MFRWVVKSFTPIRINFLSRNVVGSNGGTGGGAGTTNFEWNSGTKEQQISESLRRSLPGITFISVQDISGGCGAMYQVSVEAKEFIGLNTVNQHRLVTNALKKEIAEMHGIRIYTTTPKDQDKK